MIPLIIGGVTLAVVSYVIKEVCEEEGCPWDKKLLVTDVSSVVSDTSTEENIKKSKRFHKFKKNIYKISMQEYQEFLEQYNLENKNITTDIKLEKQIFSDEKITDELESYIEQISNTLEILSHDLSLGIELMQNEKFFDKDTITNLNNYANNIYNLSHLKLFDIWGNINKIEILSVLVKAMRQTAQKKIIQVDLAVA
jgi:hypothetical protein